MVDVFLTQGNDGPSITPLFKAHLVSFSRQGADVALTEIMYESTHLALTPMSSRNLLINITMPAGNPENSFTVAARPVWFDKKNEPDIPPFRIGLQFIENLSAKQFQLINRGFQ